MPRKLRDKVAVGTGESFGMSPATGELFIPEGAALPADAEFDPCSPR